MSKVVALLRHPVGRYFVFPTITLILVWGFALGLRGPLYLLSVMVLTGLEVTLSFDNATIDAKLLARMSPRWQKVFLTIGVVIGVGVVRMIFPILMVSITTALGFGEVWHEAWHNQALYQTNLEAARPLIVALAAPYLAMTFLTWLVTQDITDTPKYVTHEWPLARFERWLKRATKGSLWFPICTVVTVIAGIVLVDTVNHPVSYVSGVGFPMDPQVLLRHFVWLAFALVSIGVFSMIHWWNVSTEKKLEHNGADSHRDDSFIAGFKQLIRLEVVDASFSLDSVSGAFAITPDFLAILAGLGVGALFVRAFTKIAVDHNTLGKFKYLENGAHWSVGMLAVLLPVSVWVNIPDLTTGILSITIIGVAVWSSHRRLRRLQAT
jgi:hypothetical protein